MVFDLEKPHFVVEFYADILSPPPNRSFDLALIAPYAAAQGSISLRQPARASDMQITPAMTQTGTDSLGNPLYSQQLGPLVAGQEIPLSVAYTKADADPSVSATQEPLPAQATPDPRHRDTRLAAMAGRRTAGRAGRGNCDLSAIAVAATPCAKSRQARRREDRERGTSPVRKSPPGVSKPPCRTPSARSAGKNTATLTSSVAPAAYSATKPPKSR